MRPIPLKLREQIASDPFMKKCCLCKESKAEWHHAIIYARKQLNEKWAIVPACEKCHKTRIEELLRVALNRATLQELIRISKAEDYIRKKKYLNEKYGIHN